jgi:branched-chain amino acid transport system ATP-binding protein
MQIGEKEVVIVLGSNGAGKTTLAKTISGLIKQVKGSIRFLGKEITRMKPHEIVKLGITHCLERNKIAPELTVNEHLMMGAYTIREKHIISEHLNKVYKTFPILRERKNQIAGTLSGGERQMLSIGMTLMVNPRLLILDEPSQGLQPSLRQGLIEKLQILSNEQGFSILLTEQDAYFALELCHRGYIIENGRVVFEGDRKKLMDADLVKKTYLGV